MRRLVVSLALSWLPVAPALGAEVVPTAPLDSVLATHVHQGAVDYGSLARGPGPLRRYLATAAGAHPEHFDRAHQVAFWINAYNARVLDGVIRRPGLTSVLDSVKARGFFTEKRQTGGRGVSLDDIERRILLGGLTDARVHFVLNCASTSCPLLPVRALSSATLDSSLSEAARRFLADRSKNRWAGYRALELSAIFDWHRDDFYATSGSVLAFVDRYWTGVPRPTATTTIRYLPYDWSLNGTW